MFINITDVSPPTSNSPVDASYKQNSSATINWTLTDNVAPGYYIVYCNGIVQNASTTWVNNTNLQVWVNTSTVGNNWNYTIVFNDSAGNSGTPDTVFINITNTAPTVTLMTIAGQGNASYTSDNTTNIQFNTTDKEQFVLNCSIYINGTLNNTNISVTTGTPTNITTTELADGKYLVYVNCSDGLLSNVSQTWGFTVDTTNPQVAITSPTPGQYFNTTTLTINGTSTDTNLNYTNITVYNSTWSAVNSTINNSATWSWTVTIIQGDGLYHINATGYDNATNSNTTSINVTIDTTAPAISFNLETEPNNTYFNRNWVYANWTFTEDNLANITAEIFNSTGSSINQTTFTSATYEINWTLIGLDEEYVYNVTVCDVLNRCNNTETRIITLDDTNPQISFSANTTTQGYHSQAYIYTCANITETNIGTVTYYNGTANQTISSPYCVNTTDLSDGTYSIQWFINDSAGNQNQTTARAITLDTTYPQISFSANTTTQDYHSQTYIYTCANITETNIGTVTLFNTSANETIAAPYCKNITNLATDANYTIRWFINDSAGNQNQTELRWIYLDYTNPQIHTLRSNDTDNVSRSDRVLNFTVNATDTNIASVTLNGTLMTEGTGGIWYLSSNASDLGCTSDGSCLLTATATDKAGNANETNYVLTIDDTKPWVNNLTAAPSSAPANSSINISANVTDPSGVGTVRANVSWDSNYEIIILTNVTDIYSANFTNTSLRGIYNVTIIANDTAGNLNGTETTTFRIYGCGDTICDNGETCSSCETDCGGCSGKKGCNHDDDKCDSDEYCDNRNCVKVQCGCGVAGNHTCYEYECCSAQDCRKDQQCSSSHMCQNIPAVNENNTVKNETGSQNQTAPQNRTGSGNQTVSGNQTEENLRLVLEALKNANKGENVTLTVTDGDGNRLPNVTVRVIFPSGETRTYTTDDNGQFTFTASEGGTVRFEASKEGYIGAQSATAVKEGEITNGSETPPPQPQNLPSDRRYIWVLAALLIIGLAATLVFLALRKKKRRKTPGIK
ncbi:MAG: hypothetical protein MSIBF_05555 [Candidatus Altiarchaeales archaeon IMC4]|nr:MAG: hypothetical protein MSIBF_05555 [Candidatus Altiarchaeales archaeon IMC4]